MDSALTPREIQARVRSGASLDEVAQLAGVSADEIEPYAAPALAERDQIAGMALQSQVRSHGGNTHHRNLGAAISERLSEAGVDPKTIAWDTFRNESKRWILRAVWPNPSAPAEADPESDTAEADPVTEDDDVVCTAEFQFDLASRVSMAINQWAKWLIGDGPHPDAREDSDQLAIIRALANAERRPGTTPQAAPAPSTSAPTTEPDATPTESTAAPEATNRLSPPTEEYTAPSLAQYHQDAHPSSLATPQEIGEEVEADMDQALSLAPRGSSDLDILYDMLGGIAEDSVDIYADLDERGPTTSLHDDVDDTTSLENEATERLAEELRQLRTTPPGRWQSASELEAQPEAETQRQTEAQPEDEGAAEPEPESEPAQPAPAEPEQPALVEGDKKPAPRTKRRGRRAQVPSWDEIMFGSPPSQKED